MTFLVLLSSDNIEELIKCMYESMYVLNYDARYIDYSYDCPPTISKEVLLHDDITQSKIIELKDKLLHLQEGIKFFSEWNYLPDEYFISSYDLKILLKICYWFFKIHYKCEYEEFKRKTHLTFADDQLVKTIECIKSQIECDEKST